ncbi:hypothetical protein [Rasiella sp. SM2506]|uniref:hypothetical protein n=1 Tax=Rasiella sp. SM2506 TaxID=3423914 RepID=UPI003D79DA21
MKFKLLLVACLIVNAAFSQVGIGTTTPDATSVLDISSGTKGFLAPRMTTAQRTAITTPANSLLVYDTDLKSFYYYDTPSTTWRQLSGAAAKRDNYVLVKSITDFPAPSGGKITLDENTLYEINGLITLTAPIELNDAQLLGRDAGEDILFKASGAVFTGTTGGNVKNLTITGGGTVFAITGGTSLLFQNCIVSGMGSVGTISGVGLYFSNIVQFIGNTTGVTYTNIGNILLNNQGWLGSNGGTYEKLTGTFGLVEKVSGFSTVPSGAIGFDVSAIGLTVGTGILNGTAFSGAGQYVNRYNTGSYTGFNFNNNWTVNAPGIPRESNDVATGNINLTASITSPVNTTLTGTGTASRRKLNGPTTSTNLFRFERSGNNKLIYKGNKNRFFQVNASLSFSTSFPAGSPLVTTYALYIAKGSGAGPASVIQETRVYGRLTTSTSEVIAVPILGTIELNTDDYIEIWAERESGNGNIESASLNATIN